MQRIGSWWDRRAEIDVLAISESEKAALVGECKCSINPPGTNLLDELKQKSAILTQEYGIEHFQYALSSRSGFTPALEETAAREGVGLYGVEELVRGG